MKPVPTVGFALTAIAVGVYAFYTANTLLASAALAVAALLAVRTCRHRGRP